MLREIVWKIGGEQGQGLDPTSDVFATVCNRMGYWVYAYKTFSSRIKGGHTDFTVRVSQERKLSPAPKLNMLVAIDQEIVQGGPANNAAAGKVARTVTLQLAPEQVKKLTVAGQRGKLTLAVRSAVDQQDTGDTDTAVVVYAGNKVKKYSVKKHDTGSTGTKFSADVSPTIAR